MLTRERTRTFLCPAGAGPLAVAAELYTADNARITMRAWIGNFGAANVYIFAGSLTAAQCANALADATDQLDAVAITGAGQCEWMPDQDARAYTVYFEAANTSGQTQTVTVIIREEFDAGDSNVRIP